MFLVFGCVLIYLLLRRVAAGVPAALFGVALFLACPLVIRRAIVACIAVPGTIATMTIANRAASSP